jgi:hypothetical protein
MVVDVNAWIGHFPFRNVGAGPVELLAQMEHLGIDVAWVSHLAAVYWRDPTAGNSRLYAMAERHGRLKPVPAIHPGLPNWTTVLGEAIDQGVPAVRADPTFYGLAPAGPEMGALLPALGEAGLPLVMAVKFEDGRQRHPADGAAELTAAAVRQLIRFDSYARLLVTGADRDFIEQVHYGSTAAEAERILWDVSWIWGPPEDHLAHLISTIGPGRFCFGTGMPLRLPENSIAKLDLAELGPPVRARIDAGNLDDWGTGPS